ncbi:MAG: hypothetical protein ACR2MM_05305 [Flavobacteriaceae bacterium]
MKIRWNSKFLYMLMFWGCLIPTLCMTLQAQSKKNRVRLSADFVNIMEGEAMIEFKATSRIDKTTQPVAAITIDVYDEGAGQEVELGQANTDPEGKGKFVIDDLNQLHADSTGTYTLGLRFKGNDSFRKLGKSITFKHAVLNAGVIVKDSINYVRATLTEADTIPIVGESVTVYVARLFRPLRLGEEFNFTDDSGTVIVPIEEGIPALEGKLELIVELFESDSYGTVKAHIEAPIGTPIELDKTHDARSRWASRSQTPLIILFFTLFLILGSWGLIIYLIRNLFSISKN